MSKFQHHYTEWMFSPQILTWFWSYIVIEITKKPRQCSFVWDNTLFQFTLIFSTSEVFCHRSVVWVSSSPGFSANFSRHKLSFLSPLDGEFLKFLPLNASACIHIFSVLFDSSYRDTHTICNQSLYQLLTWKYDAINIWQLFCILL